MAWVKTTLNNVKSDVDVYLIVDDNDYDLWRKHSTGNWITFKNCYSGHHSSPYAGRIRLSLEEARPFAKDLVNWLVEEAGAVVPDTEREPLIEFWSALIGYDDVADCLFGIVRSYRPATNNVVWILRDQVQVLEAIQIQNPELAPPELSAQLAEITNKLSELRDAYPLPSLDELEQILVLPPAINSNFQNTRRNNRQTRQESEAPQTFVNLVESLSIPGRQWLAQLTLDLIGRIELEARLRLRLRGYLWNFVQHDHNHYLLFGQNEQQIVDSAWLAACSDYINHFRCNFGCFVTEAMVYQTITIIGTPDVSVPVTEDEEIFLRDYLPHETQEFKHFVPDLKIEERPFQLERLWVRTADELKTLLDERVSQGMPFQGGDVGPHVPNQGPLE